MRAQAALSFKRTAFNLTITGALFGHSGLTARARIFATFAPLSLFRKAQFEFSIAVVQNNATAIGAKISMDMKKRIEKERSVLLWRRDKCLSEIAKVEACVHRINGGNSV